MSIDTASLAPKAIAEESQLLKEHDAKEFKLPVHSSITKVTPLLSNSTVDLPERINYTELLGNIGKDVAWMDAFLASRSSSVSHFEHQLTQVVSSDSDWLGPLYKPTGSKYRFKSLQEHVSSIAHGKRGKVRPIIATSVRPNPHWVRMAEEAEMLTPIRLELEHEGIKLRDTFTWNLREPDFTLDAFVQHYLADMCLPQATHAYFTREIANVVTEQINESKGIAWEANVLTTFRNQQEDDNDRVLQNAHHVNEELRIEIKLDITLNNINLSDKVEWDISDPRNNPEEFAQQFANDLGLPGEFTTAIAHSIREQADSFQRSLGLIEHVVGHPINNDELKYQFLPPVSSSSLIAGHSGSSVYGIAPTANSQPFTSLIRSKQAILAFTPRLDQLSYEEIAIKEKEREREARRKRRSTRGRQRVNLPDRESVKTHRTLVPKPGSKEVSSHQPDVDGEGVIWAEAEFAQPWKYKRVWPPGSMKADEERRKTPRYEQQVASDDDSASQPPHVPKRNQLNNLNRADSFAPHVNGSSNSPYQYAQTMSDQGQSSIPVAGPSRRGGIGRGRKKGTAHSPAPLYQRQSASPAPTNALVGDYESLGLHPVWIEGRWHCSNCGGPDGIVQGKRKGPAGDKTLCAACGKYYTRYKKHRPCVYTIDPVRHREFIQADQEAAHIASTLPDSLRHARIASNGPSGNTADPLVVRIMPRAQSPISELSRDSSPEMYRPPPRRGRSPKHESPAYTNYDKFDQEEHHSRSRSDTTSSSASSNVPLAALSSAPSMGPPQANAIQSSSTYFDDLLPQVQSQNSQNAKVKLLARPPPWMLKAAASLRAERPDDKFDITAKGPKPGDDPSNQEFRIRCMDCPGKLYTPGPGETLDNFKVHLKNLNHRGKVEARTSGLTS